MTGPDAELGTLSSLGNVQAQGSDSLHSASRAWTPEVTLVSPGGAPLLPTLGPASAGFRPLTAPLLGAQADCPCQLVPVAGWWLVLPSLPIGEEKCQSSPSLRVREQGSRG